MKNPRYGMYIQIKGNETKQVKQNKTDMKTVQNKIK